MSGALGREGFAECAHVSRETCDRLAAHLDLLRRWQPRINLVGSATLGDAWRRHILDSAQLAPLVPSGARVADIGSGAGFPGLVLAILGTGPVTLVESDARKAAFLREAVRVTGAPAVVANARAETLDLAADVATARACAPLRVLLGLAHRLAPRGLFLKGAAAEDEIAAARRDWRFSLERHPSRTAPDGVVLDVGGMARVR